jgi:hypothetical protein
LNTPSLTKLAELVIALMDHILTAMILTTAALVTAVLPGGGMDY